MLCLACIRQAISRHENVADDGQDKGVLENHIATAKRQKRRNHAAATLPMVMTPEPLAGRGSQFRRCPGKRWLDTWIGVGQAAEHQVKLDRGPRYSSPTPISAMPKTPSRPEADSARIRLIAKVPAKAAVYHNGRTYNERGQQRSGILRCRYLVSLKNLSGVAARRSRRRT